MVPIKTLVVPVELPLHEATRKLAFDSGRTMADQVRFLLSAATGTPYRKARHGRPPAPWLVVRSARNGRGVVSRHRSQETALAQVRDDQEVIPIDEYEAMGSVKP